MKVPAETRQSNSRVASENQGIRNMMDAAIVIGIGLSLWMGMLLLRAIMRPLAQAQDVAGRIAAGDLSSVIEIRNNDEIGQLLASFRNMQTSLQSIVAEIKGIVEAAALRGDFSVKMDLGGKARYMKELSELLNQLSRVTGAGIDDVVRV